MRYIIKLSEMWGDRLRLSVACQLMGGCEIRISELSESTPRCVSLWHNCENRGGYGITRDTT